jgi:hypothetical protein
VKIAAMVVLGTLLLAMGQRSILAPLVVWMAAMLSVVCTDFTGWFRLHRNLAALAAFGVLGLFLPDLIRYENEARLFVLADLLIWWQVVFLFIARDPQRYRPLMLVAAVMGKFAYGAAVLVMFSQGRITPVVLGAGLVDIALGALFVVAFIKTRELSPATGSLEAIRSLA